MNEEEAFFSEISRSYTICYSISAYGSVFPVATIDTILLSLVIYAAGRV